MTPSLPRLLLLTLAVFAAPMPAAPQDRDAAPIRVGLRARNGGADRLTSLRYIGGFETKTMLLETLVSRGGDGRIQPGLASRWAVEDGGRSFLFELREGAKFHDGTAVTAAAVRVHFRRWMGLPEHDWLRVNRHIRDVEVESDRVFRVKLDQPYALLEDLLAINPCAVVGPGSKDWEGEFMRPIGTGPFRFVGAFDRGRRWRLAAVDPEGPTVDVTFYPRGRDLTPVFDLIQGRIEAFVGGWDEDLPSEWLATLGQDPRFQVATAPGSSVVYLTFKMDEGPTHDRALRQRIADSLDRRELIRVVEGGRADPATTWAAPSVAFWPKGPATARLRSGKAPGKPSASSEDRDPIRLRVTGGRGSGRSARVAIEVVAQLRRAGFQAEFVAAAARLPEAAKRVVDASGAVTPLTTESGEIRIAGGAARRGRLRQAEIRVEVSHGMPYCPHQSLVARFGVRKRGQGKPASAGVLAELRDLVEEGAGVPLEQERQAVYARIQGLMDREVVVVPLYAPWRVAAMRTGIEGVVLGPDVYRVDLTGLKRGAGR